MIPCTTIAGIGKLFKIMGGFAISGWTLKKLYDHFKRDENNAPIDRSKTVSNKPAINLSGNNEQLFFLESIKDLLSSYSVAVSEYKAFHILLNRIEHQEYKNIIGQALSSINSASSLRDFVENQAISPVVISFRNCGYGPSITFNDIENEAKEKGYTPVQGESINDKITFIVNCSKTKSLIDFMNKYGERMSKILENDSTGLDCGISLKSLKTDLEMEQILNNY